MSNTGTKGLPAGTNAFPQPDVIGKAAVEDPVPRVRRTGHHGHDDDDVGHGHDDDDGGVHGPTVDDHAPSGGSKEVRDHLPGRLVLDQAETQARAKGLLAAAAPRSATSKPERQRHSPPLPHEYQQAITRMATQHRRKFSSLFSADLTIRDRGAHLYRRLVFPQLRGRKPTKRVLKAVEIIKGLGRKRRPSDWKAIDLACLPARGRRTELEWSDLRSKFRHAVKAYLKRHKL